MFVRSTNGTAVRMHGVSSAIIPILLYCGTAISATSNGKPDWKQETNPSLQSDRLSTQSVSAVLLAASASHAADSSKGYLLVELGEIPDALVREQLAQAGLTLLSPVGSKTYFARASKDADMNLIQGRVVDAGSVTRAHKLHPMIQSGEMPSWAVVPSAAQVDGEAVLQRDASGAISSGIESNTVAAYVMLHRDVDAASPELDALVQAHKGTIRSVVMSMNTLVVEIPFGKLKELSDDERVQWVEPPLPPMETTNASNRVVTQVDIAQSAPYSLDGTGVTVFVYDGGSLRTSHNDFSGRAVNIDSSGVSFHATHVAGTIGGDGSTISAHKGMAPGVNLLGAGFEVAGGLSAGFLYTDPGDLESDYSQALSLGASISNNSIGSNVAQNAYPCNWHGDYGITSGTIDNVIRGSLGDPMIVFWAAGNERGNGSCGTSFGTTAPPSNNKNAISIGALNSNDDSMTSFSSWGPSDDGRIRPVVSAPGCQSGSDNGVTSTGDGSDSQYITLCGTSMASPTAAGIGALILQDFRVQYPDWGDPSNQLMKVFLIEGAEDILNTGPDYQSGYGSIRAVDSIDFMRNGNFREEMVDQAGVASYSIEVDPGDPVFRVTLAWDDPASAPNVSSSLVNDLDLVVIDPSGTQHYPWTLNPASPNAGAVRTQKDDLNNIEQVQVENPEAGVWQVQVVGASVSEGPQGFAIGSMLDIGDGLLALSLEEQASSAVLPNTDIQITGVISEGVDTLIPGSVVLNYRYQSGSFTSSLMNDNNDGTFSATIPGADCGEFIEYYISAQGVMAGVKFSPVGGESQPARSEVGEVQLVLSDDFQSENGWTVSGDALDGQWTRGVPVDCSSRGAPGSDADGSGICWITDNDSLNSCNSDIDNGTTTLTSPIYSIPDGGEFTFDYWYSDIPTGEVNGDQWMVEASSDGGSTWTAVRTSTSVSSSWRTDTIVVGQEIEASSMMRFRFSADDIGTQNVIEAGLDNIRITQFVCEDGNECQADLSGDGALDFFDVSAFLSAFGNNEAIADFTGDGTLDFFDVSAFITAFNIGCP